MSRNIFISFLGTNNYLPTNYLLADQKYENVRFVQEALVNAICKNWTSEDLVLVLCTEESEKRNWLDNGHQFPEQLNYLEGLHTRLNLLKKEKSLNCEIRKTIIPEGFTESEIWQIFRIVYDELNESDHVYLDVTHAFRSIPLFMMVLLSYSGFLKKTIIEGIYYGAFEKLGPAYKVKDLPIEKRDAPIIDLMNFATLMDWTQAAADFVHYGNPNNLSSLAARAIAPILKDTQGKDLNAAAIRKLSTALPVFIDQIRTNRGKDIYSGDQLKKINTALSEIKSAVIEPFSPIFDQLKKELESFSFQDNIMHGFSSANWCYKNGYWQQAITLLFENTITWLCVKLNLSWEDEYNRNLISSLLKFIHEKTPQSKWHFDSDNHKKMAESLITNELLNSFAEVFNHLRDLRNDINHAGIRKNACKPQSFQDSLKKHMSAIFVLVNYQIESSSLTNNSCSSTSPITA